MNHPFRNARNADRSASGFRTASAETVLPQQRNRRESRMARALWKGFIAFGLVNVPVELYPAESKKGLSFSMLDKRDMSPVGYKRYSKKSGNEVTNEDIVKGYEYEKDQYVVLSP